MRKAKYTWGTCGNVPVRPHVPWLDKQIANLELLGYINRSRPQYAGPKTDFTKLKVLEWFQTYGPNYDDDDDETTK